MGAQGWFVVLLLVAVVAGLIHAYRIDAKSLGKRPHTAVTWLVVGLLVTTIGGGLAVGRACARAEERREVAAREAAEAGLKTRGLAHGEIKYVSQPDVNVRSGPGEVHPVVRKLSEGEQVCVLASGDGVWRRLGEAVGEGDLVRPLDQWVHETLIQTLRPITAEERAADELAAQQQAAPAGQTFTREELKTLVSATILLNGYLCAEVVDIRPLVKADTYEVTCIEYRGGRGTKLYIFDAARGSAFPQ